MSQGTVNMLIQLYNFDGDMSGSLTGIAWCKVISG